LGGEAVDFCDLSQHALPLSHVFAPHRCDQAGVDMAVEDAGVEFAQRGLDGLDLPDQIDAVGVTLHHPLYSADVALDVPQTLERVGFVHILRSTSVHVRTG
jgi:hypothetical protein